MGNLRLLFYDFKELDSATSLIKLFTWLMALWPDQVLQSGSMTGDGVCALVNKVWCSNTVEADGQWFPDVLLFYSKCRNLFLVFSTFVAKKRPPTKILLCSNQNCKSFSFFIFLICFIASLCLAVEIPISFSRQV